MKTLILTLAATALSTAALADALVTIAPPLASPLIGQTFVVDVDISGVTNLDDWQFDFQYDPSVLSVVAVNEGTFLSNVNTTSFYAGSNDPTAGVISSIADTLIGSGPGASGSGTLFDVQFQTLQTGTSPLSLAFPILQDPSGSDIPATLNGSTVTVVTPEPSAGWTILLSLALLFCEFSAKLRKEGGSA